MYLNKSKSYPKMFKPVILLKATGLKTKTQLYTCLVI